MWNDWFFPFALPFMQQAFFVVMIVSIPMALLSCFLVLRGWSLMGDAISHSVLPGIVLAYIMGIPLLFGAFLAGLGCSVLIGYIDENSRIKRDTVMGVVFSAMFALGLVLFTQVKTNVHLDHLLFGSVLGIEQEDLWQSGVLAALVTVVVMVRYKDLLLCSFDRVQAHISGLRVRWWHYVMLLLISLSIVSTLKVAGLIMSIGLLIAPGAIAFLLCRRLVWMLWTAVLVTQTCSVLALYCSFYWDSAPAPTIILFLALAFILAFLWRMLRQYYLLSMQDHHG